MISYIHSFVTRSSIPSKRHILISIYPIVHPTMQIVMKCCPLREVERSSRLGRYLLRALENCSQWTNAWVNDNRQYLLNLAVLFGHGCRHGQWRKHNYVMHGWMLMHASSNTRTPWRKGTTQTLQPIASDNRCVCIKDAQCSFVYLWKHECTIARAHEHKENGKPLTKKWRRSSCKCTIQTLNCIYVIWSYAFLNIFNIYAIIAWPNAVHPMRLIEIL